MKDGDVKTYFYALFDDQSGDFGLMNPDGSPKPAGEALHNLTTLLGDTGGSFSPGSLDYTLDNTAVGDNSLLMEKSYGTYWLALWNELNGDHTVTLNLANAAGEVDVFDPLTGTSAVQTVSDTDSVQIDVPDHPVLVEIVPSGASAPPATSSSTGSGGSEPTSTPTASDGITLTTPASVQATPGQSEAISGVALSDGYASSNGSQVAVTVSDTNGSLTTIDAWGDQQQGSTLTLAGTIWQVNAGLANLQFSGGTDTVQFAASDDAGNNAAASVAVSGGDGAAAPTSNTISIAATDANPVENVNSTAITASTGDHMIFIGGTGDVLTATGGTETVQAFLGGNSITTGSGDDTIKFAGSGNTIDAGDGSNQLADSGNSNTIVLPGAGQGYDNILGWITQNSDTFDLRPALSQTGWNGDASTIGNYLQVAMSDNNAIISIDPDGSSGANGAAVAALNDAPGTTLATFLAHAIT